jgi:phosphohistidine phosphatase SixA
LTPEGIKLTSQVCDHLVSVWKPTLILSSEYLRARETADRLLVASTAAGAKDGAGAPPQMMLVPELNQDSPWQEWKHAWQRLQANIDPGEVVVLVGHGPSINEILCWHSGINFNVGLKKAGFAVLKGDSELLTWTSPKALLGEGA